jgi:hypothetical protein
MPPPPSNLPERLNDDQLALLLEIAEPYARDGVWPVWNYVVARMDRRGLDAQEVIASLPRVGATGTLGLSYGFTECRDWRMLREDDKIGLTVAAALPLEELREMLADPFLRTLGYMIKLRRKAVPTPREVTSTWLESQDLLRAIPTLDTRFVARAVDVFNAEPATRLGSSSGPNPGDSSWRKEVSREVLRYADALALPAYVAKTCELVLQQGREAQRSSASVANVYLGPVGQQRFLAARSEDVPDEADKPVSRVYAKNALIAELETADSPEFRTAKLVQLLRELNFNFANNQPLACSALLRAVLDHVPPAFGAETFAQVVSSWQGRTDKRYLEKLRDFRNHADDVMHRQIGPRRSQIDMDDMPAAPALNAMLDGLVLVLQDHRSSD